MQSHAYHEKRPVIPLSACLLVTTVSHAKTDKPTEVPSGMWAQRNYFLGWSPLRIPQTHCSTGTLSVKRCLKSHLWSSTVAAQTRTGNGTRKLNLLGVCRIYPAVSSLHEKKPWLAATAAATAAAESSTVSSLWIYASARSLSFSVHRLYRPRWYRYCHSACSLLGIWQRRFLKRFSILLIDSLYALSVKQ